MKLLLLYIHISITTFNKILLKYLCLIDVHSDFVKLFKVQYVRIKHLCLHVLSYHEHALCSQC